MARTIVTSLLIILMTTAIARQLTDDFAAFTIESARRLEVRSNPRPAPPTVLLDSAGREHVIGAPGQQETLVEFIYTSCPTICVALGKAFQRAQTRIATESNLNGVQLISISFDIDRDTPEQLDAYGKAHGAEAPTWRVAKPHSGDDLRRLLAAFGIVVLDDGNGGYVHNAAVHYVDVSGRIARIVDMEDTDKLLSELGRRR